MEFKTQFDVGERVWLMKDNKPKEVIVSGIRVSYVNTNQDQIKYSAKNIVDSVRWFDHDNLFEDMLFKTKGELLKAVFGNGVVCNGKNCNALNGTGHSKECVQEHDRCINNN